MPQAPQAVRSRSRSGRPITSTSSQPGESLIGIAHKHGISLVALARTNNIQPYTKINIGDRLKVPGGRHVAERQVQPKVPAPAPHVAQPRSVPVEKVASVPVQNARMATPEAHATTESVTKTAEAAGGMPSFRWPVKGRIIAGFGPRPNGGQNDGINLAVPEGTPIKAADDGVVAYAGNELKGYGNLVLIRHANGFVSAYANASELAGQARRHHQARAGDRACRADRQRHLAATALRDPQGLDARSIRPNISAARTN